MGASAVEIARRALALIGESANLESLDEPTPEATTAKAFYSATVEEILSEFDWGFARKMPLLPESTVPPVNHWQFRYDLPSDLLVIRGQVNPLGRKQASPPNQIENVAGRVTLLTDVDKLRLIYTAKVPDPTLHPVLFQRAQTFLLASYMSASLKLDVNLSDNLFNRYQQLVSRAKTQDANQGTPDPAKDASWVRGR